jgi:AraC-like DNA-binding protein
LPGTHYSAVVAFETFLLLLKQLQMVEIHTLYSFFNFAIFLLSVIVFFDVLIQLKRPLLLKTYFLLLVSCVGGFSFLMYLDHISLYVLLCFPILKFLIWASMSLVLSHLYIEKNKKWVYILLGVATSVLGYSLYNVYTFSVNQDFSNDAFGQNAVAIFSQKFSFKVNLFPRIILLSIFTFINLRLVYLIFNKSEKDNIYYLKIKSWTKVFVLLEFVSVSVFAVMNSLLISYTFGSIMLIVMAIVILLIVLYRPRFINTQSVKLTLSNNFNRESAFNLTDVNFFTPFFINHYFLNEEATLEQFCLQNGIKSTESLQDQVVKKYNMSFSNLVNKSRVDYFIEIATSSKFKHFTIDALAKEAGFTSRHHLYKPFKKFHGGTPSDFISSINN